MNCQIALQEPDHLQNEEVFIIDKRTSLNSERKENAIDSNVTTFTKALDLLTKPVIGAKYILECFPEEMDDIPIYVCALPYCKVTFIRK